VVFFLLCNSKKLHARLDILLIATKINKMKTKLSRKRAISTVLTTVIILVSSVVLGSGVVLYGTSLFQGASQTEEISVAGTKLWVHDTDDRGIAWGATTVRNSGDKVLSVDRITVRGIEIPSSQWYVDTTLSNEAYSAALNHTGWSNIATTPQLAKLGECDSGIPAQSYLCIDQDSWGAGTSVITANASSGSVGLNTGDTAVIYFKVNNGTLTTLDAGATTTVGIFAGVAGGPLSITITGQS
jgi:hypothetical protein